MPTVSGHVNCCGIYIFSGFGHGRVSANELASFEKLMKQYTGPRYEDETIKAGKLIECVITDYQLTNEGKKWIPLLKKYGFRLVSRFRNTSSSMCNVFHYHPYPSELDEPKCWTEYKEETIVEKVVKAVQRPRKAKATVEEPLPQFIDLLPGVTTHA